MGRGLLVLLVGLTLAGCAPTYFFAGKQYNSPNEAKYAARSIFSRMLSSVEKATDPIGGRATIYLPSRSFIEQHSIVGNKTAAMNDQVSYIVSVTSMDHSSFYKAIRKSQLFDEINSSHFDNFSPSPNQRDDWTIWVDISNHKVNWFIKNATTGKQLRVPFDPGLSGSNGFFVDWLSKLRSAASNLGGDGNKEFSRKNPKKDKTIGSGTGFFVNAGGHILTNAHVIAGCRKVQIYHDGAKFDAKVSAKDTKTDLAALQTDRKPKTYAKFSPRKLSGLGTEVITFGFPLAGFLSSSGVLTKGNIASLTGLADNIVQMQITNPIQPGNSGGPVIDHFGNVTGVVVSKVNAIKLAKLTGDIAQNVNFAIKSAIAKSFLEAIGIEYAYGSEKRGHLTIDKIVGISKNFTVKIECLQ
jgi:S1-C subfamily serine protease